jgi:hypothetical protein
MIQSKRMQQSIVYQGLAQGAKCNDGKCDSKYETCETCPQDCGKCGVTTSLRFSLTSSNYEYRTTDDDGLPLPTTVSSPLSVVGEFAALPLGFGPAKITVAAYLFPQPYQQYGARFLNRGLHSRRSACECLTPFSRFKLEHVCDQCHSSRVITVVSVHTVNCDVTNGIHLGSLLSSCTVLPVHTVNCVQTLKVLNRVEGAWTCRRLVAFVAINRIYRPSAGSTCRQTVCWGDICSVRCAFSDRNFHSRMPLDPTHVHLKRTRV